MFAVIHAAPLIAHALYLGALLAAFSPGFGWLLGARFIVLARNTVVIWVVCAMTFGAQVTITVFMPTVLVSRGLDVSSSLAYIMIINIGGLVGSLLASVFGYWFKRRVVLGYGSAVAVVVAIALGSSSSLAMGLALGGLLQLMFILLDTTTFVWAPELYPTRVRAFGTGALVALRR